MTYQPIVVGSGVSGWRFLQATLDRQVQSFTQSAVHSRDTEYFRDHITGVGTAEDLVSDRRLLSVALEAFGLKDDLANTYFVRKILEDGTSARDALANKLADSRYADFSKAFGLGPNETSQTASTGFADKILSRYTAQSFEAAVGTQDEAMRISLFARRELSDPSNPSQSDEANWFRMMAAPPMRRFFETALGFPSAISRIDLDKQLEMFRAKARQTLGTDRFDDLRTPDMQERLTNLFLVRDQALSFSPSSNSASVALALLSNSG